MSGAGATRRLTYGVGRPARDWMGRPAGSLGFRDVAGRPYTVHVGDVFEVDETTAEILLRDPAVTEAL